MKIAFIVEIFPSLSQTFVLNQITGLIEHGHQVDIYAEIDKDSSKIHSDIDNYKLLKSTFYHPPVPRNRKKRIVQGIALFIKNFSKDPELMLQAINIFKYGKYAASLRMIYWAVPFVANRKDYDVIQCHFGLLGRKGMLLRKMGAISGKLITAFHGVDISQNLRIMGEDMYDDLLLDGDLFQPVIDRWANRLIDLGCNPKKIIVHRMGIDSQRFNFLSRQAPQEGPIRLITVARLTKKKGLDFCINAMAEIKRKYPNVHYEIIGGGELQIQLEELIEKLQLQATVKLLGPKNQSEVLVSLQQSHIFIHPSMTTEDGDQEGCPVSIEEAMATGLPILSTYHGGIPELVEDGVSGFLVPEGDLAALVEKLTLLIDNPQLWSEMGAAGRRKIEQQHDIQNLNDRLVEMYAQLCSPESIPAVDCPLEQTSSSVSL